MTALSTWKASHQRPPSLNDWVVLSALPMVRLVIKLCTRCMHTSWEETGQTETNHRYTETSQRQINQTDEIRGDRDRKRRRIRQTDKIRQTDTDRQTYRETETETETETHRQTDRDRHTDRQRHRQRERERDRDRDRCGDIQKRAWDKQRDGGTFASGVCRLRPSMAQPMAPGCGTREGTSTLVYSAALQRSHMLAELGSLARVFRNKDITGRTFCEERSCNPIAKEVKRGRRDSHAQEKAQPLDHNARPPSVLRLPCYSVPLLSYPSWVRKAGQIRKTSGPCRTTMGGALLLRHAAACMHSSFYHSSQNLRLFSPQWALTSRTKKAKNLPSLSDRQPKSGHFWLRQGTDIYNFVAPSPLAVLNFASGCFRFSPDFLCNLVLNHPKMWRKSAERNP